MSEGYATVWKNWKNGIAFKIDSTTYPLLFEFDSDLAIKLCIRELYRHIFLGKFLITGGRGIGKTQFTYMLLNELQKRGLKTGYISLADIMEKKKVDFILKDLDIIVIDEIDSSAAYFGFDSTMRELKNLMSIISPQEQAIILVMSNLMILKIRQSLHSHIIREFRVLINLDAFIDKEKLARSMAYKMLFCYKKLKEIKIPNEAIIVKILENIVKSYLLHQRRSVRETVQKMTFFIEKLLEKLPTIPQKITAKKAIIQVLDEYFKERILVLPQEIEIYIKWHENKEDSPIIGFIEYQTEGIKGKLGVIIEELPISKRKLEIMSREKISIFAILFGKEIQVPSFLQKSYLVLFEKKIIKNCSYMSKDCAKEYLKLLGISDKILSEVILAILDEISKQFLLQGKKRNSLSCHLFAELYRKIDNRIFVKKQEIHKVLAEVIKKVHIEVPSEELQTLTESLALSFQQYGAIIAKDNIFFPSILRKNLIDVLTSSINGLINRLEILGYI